MSASKTEPSPTHSEAVPVEARERCPECIGRGSRSNVRGDGMEVRIGCGPCDGRGWFDNRYVFDLIPRRTRRGWGYVTIKRRRPE